MKRNILLGFLKHSCKISFSSSTNSSWYLFSNMRFLFLGPSVATSPALHAQRNRTESIEVKYSQFARQATLFTNSKVRVPFATHPVRSRHGQLHDSAGLCSRPLDTTALLIDTTRSSRTNYFRRKKSNEWPRIGRLAMLPLTHLQTGVSVGCFRHRSIWLSLIFMLITAEIIRGSQCLTMFVI